MPITDMTIKDMAAALAEKKLSAVEATKAYLERIEKNDLDTALELQRELRICKYQEMPAGER